MELEQLLFQHPGLGLVDENQTVLSGTVRIQSQWFHLRLSCPHFPALDDMQCQVQELHQMKSYTATSPGVDGQWTVGDFIDHLPQIAGGSQPEPVATCGEYSNIYAEIAALHAPESFRIETNANCNRIRFSHFADHLEQHFLELDLPSLRLREHSLPDCVPWQELFEKLPSLTALVEQYTKYLEDLRPFYETFNDIDELCHVLQPSLPSTKHNWRLFVLDERVFLKLIIGDPFAPLASMSLRIIGPTHEVERLRGVYSEGLCDWDADLDIHKNLLRIFDLCFFPMPPHSSGNTSADEPQQICNICYCYQLDDGDIPLVSCDNRKCSLIYHASCLRKWFNTLADGKVFLEVSFGACPYCKAKMSTSFAELLER